MVSLVKLDMGRVADTVSMMKVKNGERFTVLGSPEAEGITQAGLREKNYVVKDVSEVLTHLT